MNTFIGFFDTSFWQAFVSNSLATLTGVVIGIPVALWLSRQQERKSEKEHKSKILQLFAAELDLNLRVLASVGDTSRVEMLRICSDIQADLKTTYWDAFSDGGEIQWIKDPWLLSQIAAAYSHVRQMQGYAARFFQLLHVSEFDLNKEAIRWTEQYLISATPVGSEIMKQALEAIDAALKKIEH